MPSDPAPPLLVIDAVGARVGIDVSELLADDRHTVVAAWADARAETGAATVTVVPALGRHGGQMLSDLSSAVTRAAIETRRGELWMLHAAGLAAPDGGVVVLVGHSGAGKTTATSVLARGWGYVSDETIGVENDGRVRPYRKPLSVITEGHEFKVQHSPGELGLRSLPTEPLRLRRLVLLDRDPSHTRARLVPVPLAEALVALAPQSSALAAMVRPLQTMKAFVERTGGVLRAEYAEASGLVELLHEVMGGTVPEMTRPVTATVERPSSPPVTHTDGVVRYCRGDVADWCELPDDRIAVLTAEPDGRGTLLVLGEAASAIWVAADGASSDELASAAVGDATEAEAAQAIERVLSELVDAGLLNIQRRGSHGQHSHLPSPGEIGPCQSVRSRR